MEELKSGAGLLRWTVSNLIYNLGFIPEDRLAWKPDGVGKSALEIAAEVVAGQRMMLPVLRGGGWAQQAYPELKSREEAVTLLQQTCAEYAGALEEAEAGSMDRMVEIFGHPVWAPRAALLPLVDALHHHGQVAYIQTLLGDGETHFEMEAAARFFARPEGGPGAG